MLIACYFTASQPDVADQNTLEHGPRKLRAEVPEAPRSALFCSAPNQELTYLFGKSLGLDGSTTRTSTHCGSDSDWPHFVNMLWLKQKPRKKKAGLLVSQTGSRPPWREVIPT
jgi:hypothetical protein